MFISHGGLIGTQEAIYYGIPIIGIPIYCDQYNNLLQVQDNGHGLILEYQDVTENKVEIMLNKILKDDTFKKKAKDISARFKDRPMKPLDTAIFWIEYVIRHKGANFAKNPSLKMNWFAYNMFDVYAFIVMITILVFLVIRKLISFLVNVVFESKNVQVSNIRKKKI